LVYGVPGAAREVGMTSTDADQVGEIRNEGRILVENSLGNQPLGTILLKSPTSRASLTNLSLRAAITSYPHTSNTLHATS
jgi:hypothetical protein